MKTLREYIDQIDSIQEGWKTGAAIGAGLGGLYGGLPGAAIGAGAGGILGKIHSEYQKTEKEKESAPLNAFKEEYEKLESYIHKLQVHYLDKFMVYPGQPGPGIRKDPDGDYYDPKKLRYVNSEFNELRDRLSKEVWQSPGQYADRINLMKQIISDFNKKLNSININKEILKAPEMPTEDLDEAGTPDAVRRIEQLVQYK